MTLKKSQSSGPEADTLILGLGARFGIPGTLELFGTSGRRRAAPWPSSGPLAG